MTQVVAAEAPEVPVDPIAVLATSFTAITTALESYKAQDGAVETAKEAETRASEALTAAKDSNGDGEDRCCVWRVWRARIAGQC